MEGVYPRLQVRETVWDHQVMVMEHASQKEMGPALPSQISGEKTHMGKSALSNTHRQDASKGNRWLQHPRQNAASSENHILL